MMTIHDLHELPKFRDGLSYLYLEHCIVDRKYKAVEAIDKTGRTMIPAASLAVLMLGPGTSITHEAVKTLTESGCSILWTGEEGVRMYASGLGETRKAYHLLRQSELVSNHTTRLQVALRMYEMRFGRKLGSGLSMEQVRGYEGRRVRNAYARASQEYGVPWNGRKYDRQNWEAGDPINRAISAASACMNGISHAAIVSSGYSPGLGFIHTGKQLSFVFDIADLYKTEITIPLAFRVTAEGTDGLEVRVRKAAREMFREHRLLSRIVDDIEKVLDLSRDVLEAGGELDSDPAKPEPWWEPPPELVGEIAI